MADGPAELSTLLSGPLFETITRIEPNELTDGERALVPDWWIEAVGLPPRDGLERALAVWQVVWSSSASFVQVAEFVLERQGWCEPVGICCGAAPYGDRQIAVDDVVGHGIHDAGGELEEDGPGQFGE